MDIGSGTEWQDTAVMGLGVSPSRDQTLPSLVSQERDGVRKER